MLQTKTVVNRVLRDAGLGAFGVLGAALPPQGWPQLVAFLIPIGVGIAAILLAYSDKRSKRSKIIFIGIALLLVGLLIFTLITRTSDVLNLYIFLLFINWLVFYEA